jgi:DnaJ family protein A protein 5
MSLPGDESPATISETVTPADGDYDGPAEVSKRDKRRAKEAKKKAAEEAELLARKEARKQAKNTKPDTLAQQNEKLRKSDGRARNDEPFVTPKSKKGKGKQPQRDPDEFSEEKVERAVQAVRQLRDKMVEKWGESWTRKP